MNDASQQSTEYQHKSRKGLYIGGAVVVLLIILGAVGYVVFNTGSSEPATTAEGNIVRYTTDGYQPQNIRINVGEMVTWKNETSGAIAVDSNPHPIHTSYQPLNLGRIEPGAEKQLTFSEAGTYNYHNHLNALQRGTVTVE